VDSSLPVLVTRLPDKRALARLLRAALRHEVAPVALIEAPRQGTHTLDLRVNGSPSVSLLAELAGAPTNGHFPLRLRPLHRAQAAELYALLEAEQLGGTEAPRTPIRGGETAPLSPPPDTIVPSRTLAIDHASASAPIARAMTGAAPPPVALSAPPASAKGNLDWGASAAPASVDPRKTARSLEWSPPTGRTPAPRRWAPDTDTSPSHAPATPRLDDDPRRTARSPSWAPPPASEVAARQGAVPDGPGADDLSLSVSVVFEPGAEEYVPESDGPSLSVSVIFEPESRGGASRSSPPAVGEPPISDTQASVSPLTPTLATDTPLDTMHEATEASVGAPVKPPMIGELGADPFFDEALANLPMDLSLEPPHDAMLAPEEDPTLAPETTSDPSLADESDVTSLDDEPADDDADTLIRLPTASPSSAPARGRSAPIPAAGMPPPPSEDLTPTDTAMPAPRPKRQTTGAGRKKRTSRHGKGKKKTRHPADAEMPSSGGAFASDEVATGRRAKPEDETDPLLGRKIADGKYTIESLIGSGAAGAVYKATHRELRRTVAIKVLHPHYQHDPQFMKSFRGEALAASQLDHPNVMRVLDFGQEPDGLVYIVMEFLSGRTLQSLLDEERRLTPDRAVEIMIQVCAALSVAHDNGIIHRDVKPDNIMLVPSRNDEGRTFELVKVCDFGIAALQNQRVLDDDEPSLAETVIAGTPEYMSPEQARGIEIDARSDVYACGMCLYELVTGRPPFLGDNAAEILIKQLEEAPRPPSQLIKGLDSLLEEIILRAIQKDPAKRQQSARELRVELKEIIDPADAGTANDDDERSIVENVPVLDDPASGFPGFFIALASAVLRFGRFERGHPESAQAMKELVKSTRAALRGRREITIARRDSSKAVGFAVLTGHAEIAELKRLLGSQLYGSFGYPFIDALVKKGIAALTLREGIPDAELQYIIEMLLGPHAGDDLRKELLGKPLRFVSALFAADVVGRDRKLSWKVGLSASRLARDLRALSSVRGISLKKMREIREDLVSGVAHLLTKGDEVRQFLFNADLIDEAVANLRGFSGFHLAPLLFDRLPNEASAEAVGLLLTDFEKGELDRNVLQGYLRAFAQRLLGERSPKSDAAVAELYRRHIVTDEDLPRDLKEQIRASSLAEALIREPSQFLRTLDLVQDPDDYGREMGTLEAAMAVLARRAEAGALLAAVGVLARHAKGGGPGGGARENHALRAMKSIIDKQRLVPIANALLVGPPHQREAARQLLVLAGSAGAHALFIAREALTDPAARPLFVKTFRETGPAGWSLLSAVLPRMEVQNDTDIAFVEDLLRTMPDRPDPALGEAVSKFLAHPRLRPAALAAIAPLWGERARKPLLDALEFAEEPARIVAITELRRLRGIDEQVLSVVERFLTMKGSASEELRAAAAAALPDVAPALRPRAVALLAKGVEGKRGLVARIRGDGGTDESVIVIESMARALLQLDRAEGMRAVKARLQRSDGIMRARLTAVLQAG